MIEFPGLRRGLILCIKDLSDFEMQKMEWTNSQYVYPFWNHLERAIMNIEDDGLFNNNLTVQIGVRLKNQEEVDAIKPLIKALNVILDTIGIKQPDSSYLDSLLWQDVVDAAKHAYEVLMRDEDLDALLEAEEKRT